MDARTDDGRRTLKDHKSSLSTSCSGELKMVFIFLKKIIIKMLKHGDFEGQIFEKPLHQTNT